MPSEPEIIRDFREAFKDVMTNPRYGASGRWDAMANLRYGLRQERMKMEPSLEYLHEYPVEQVQEIDDGIAIQFKGGAIVTITGGDGAATPEIEGLSLITTILSSRQTRLVFGRTKRDSSEIQNKVEVAIDNAEQKVSISDPRFPSSQETEPEEHPAEVEGSRIQDGPDSEREIEAGNEAETDGN